MPYPQRPFQICLRFVRQIFESSPWRARNGNAGGKPVGPGSDPRIARAASAREFGGEPRGVVVPFPGVRGWRGADGDEPAGPLPGGSAGARSCPGGLRGGRSAQVCGVVLRFFCAIQFAALLLSTANTAVSAAETRVAPGLTGLPTSSLEDYDPALNGEGDARAEFVLNDGDSAARSQLFAVALSVNPAHISEDDAATTVTVTAELDRSGHYEDLPVTVSVGSADDAAASGVDYAAVSEFVVTIPAGSQRASESFTLTPIDDEIMEGAERITVHGVFEDLVVEPTELVLNDDDSPSSAVALSVNPEQISEDDAATTVTVTAELDQGARKEATAVTVSVGSANDWAAPGVDYAAVSDFVVTIPAGSRRGSESFTLTPIDDEIAEDAERITVHGVFGGLLVEPTELVLNDDDSPSSAVALSVNPEQISEDDAATTVTVTAELDQGARKEATAVTVSVGSANDAAAPGVDYAAVSDFVVTIPAGSRRGSESFTLTPIDDEIVEDAERITVHGVFEGLLVEPVELVLNDDDPASSSVVLSVNPERISEDDAATTVTVTAELDQGARKEATAVTVSVGSADDAAAPGVDYAAVSDFVVTIPAGSRRGSESFTLTPIDDEIAEDAERIIVHGVFEGLLVEPTELVLNDDDPTSSSVVLSVNPEQISEDDAATTVTVTAELDQGARKEATAVTVSVGSADDAAAPGADYAAVSDFVVTIPAGSRSGSESFTLTPIDDEIAEDAERITVHGVFGGLLVEPAELVLNDDDPASSSVALSVNPEQISEDDAATTVTVTAKLDQGARKEATAVTVSVGSADDAAAPGVDYAAVSDFVVTIPAGSRHGTESFTLTPIDDQIAEDAERITVHGVFGGLLVEPAELVLNDDDPASSSVALSVNPEQISEDDAATTVTVTAKLDQGARKEATAVTVSVGSADDAAAPGVDYAAVSDFVVTIPAGSRHGTESFTLTPIDDEIAEDAERITVHGVFEGLIVEPAELVLNDDGDSSPISVALSVNPEQISEDDAATTVTVTAELLSARKEATVVTVSVGSAGDAAASGVDYAAVSEFVVTIPEGSRYGSESFTLTPIDDEIAEDAERITVHGVFEDLIVEPAELVLNDDDPASSSVALSVNPEQISEDDAATTVTVTAELDQGARKEATAVTVSVGSANDWAAPGVDYAAVSDFVVTIPAGSRRGSESFTLTPIDDEIAEDAERITVHGVFEGLIVEPAELVLNDDDPTSSSVALSVNPEQISEDDAATTVTVTAELDQGARNEATVVTVSVGSAGDAAASGVDYAAVSDFVVTIPAGSRSGSESFTLTPIDDEIVEDAERITVHGVFEGLLVEPTELVLTDGDPTSSSVALSVNPEQISEDDAATTVTVTAELDQGARNEATAVTVSVGSANDSAASGVDYAAVSEFVVTIPAGSRSGSESFTLTPIDDEIAEDAERITVHGVFGGLLVEPTELVLNDDDPASSSVALSVNPEQISEDDAATTVTVTAELDQGARKEATAVAVSVGSANDWAAPDVDYAAVSDFVVTIPAGSRRGSESFTLTPIDDEIAEDAERITVHGVFGGLLVEPTELVLNDDGDSPPSSVVLSLDPFAISEEDGAHDVALTAQLFGGMLGKDTSVSIRFGATGDAAVSGVDYRAIVDSLVVIPAGEESATTVVRVMPNNDDIAEGPERITVHGVSRGLTVEPAILLLNDGDSPSSSVALSVNPEQISEDDAATTVTVTAELDQGARNEATAVAVSVGSANDWAAPGVDYAAVSDFVVTIPAGSRRGSESFTLTPIDDEIAEDAERITVHGVFGGLLVEPAELVLNDDGDSPPSSVKLLLDPVAISEEGGAHEVALTAQLFGGMLGKDTSVSIRFGATGDAAVSGVDYRAIGDSLVVIPAGEESTTTVVRVMPNNDDIAEGPEQITVDGRSRGLTVEPATLVLNDDDLASSSVALSVNPEQISEDDAVTTVTVTAELDQGAGNEATVVTVSVGSPDDSAASSVDYAAVSDFVVTIPAGSRRGSGSFTLTPIDDRIFEGVEQITVHGRSEGLTVEPAELVLNDGDSPSSSVKLSVNPEQILEDDAATTVTVTAKLDQGARNEATVVTVSVGGAGDSAASSVDYAAVSDFVVTIPAGSRRGSESFTLTPIDDRIFEGAEQITVDGRSEGLTVEPAELVLNDSDSPSSSVKLSVNPEQISEDDAATTVTVTAKLDQGARNEATAVTVSVGGADDSAASSVDYAAVSDFVVTIPAGSRRGSGSFTLTPIDDRISEGAEQITVDGRSEGLTVEPAELVLNDGDSPSSSVALSVNPEQISEDDAATTVTVTAKLDQGARNEATVVTVSVGGADDSAASRSWKTMRRPPSR